MCIRDRLHTGGIYAALSEDSANTVIEAVKKAKQYGTIVSYDLKDVYKRQAEAWAKRSGKLMCSGSDFHTKAHTARGGIITKVPIKSN